MKKAIGAPLVVVTAALLATACAEKTSTSSSPLQTPSNVAASARVAHGVLIDTASSGLSGTPLSIARSTVLLFFKPTGPTGGSYRCSGTLIKTEEQEKTGEQAILTAAHCVLDSDAPISTGSNTTYTVNPHYSGDVCFGTIPQVHQSQSAYAARCHAITHIYVPPNAWINTSHNAEGHIVGDLYNTSVEDVAIVTIAADANKIPFNSTENYQSVDVYSGSIKTGDGVYIAGFGITEDPKLGILGNLYYAPVDVMGINDKANYFELGRQFGNNPNKLTSTCSGDSGGPTYYQTADKKLHVIAVTAYGSGCGENPGASQIVSKYALLPNGKEQIIPEYEWIETKAYLNDLAWPKN